MCGILCFLNPRNKNLHKSLIKSLHELQNRGKDSCGVFSLNNNNDWKLLKRFGTISNILSTTSLSDQLLNRQTNNVFLIQTRYITSQQKKYTQDIYNTLNTLIENSETDDYNFQSFYKESQPLIRNIHNKPLCMIHNGNIKIINKFIQQTLNYDINVSDYKTDTSLLLDYIEHYIKKKVAIPLILKSIVENIDGAYNLIIYYNNMVYIVRDSLGMRPLSIARNNNMICISSESSLYNNIDFTFEREIKPGEVLICREINSSNSSKNKEYEMLTYGIFKYNQSTITNISSCALEYVYLSNNDSIFNGILIKDARINFGKQLWNEESEFFKKSILQQRDDFIISYVPNTAYYACEGYGIQSTIGHKKILNVKKKGRTFIISNQKDRLKALYEKFDINVDEIIKKNGIHVQKKKLILIDDSIVRGNTLLIIVQKLLETKLFSEIHIRSASPPIYNQDYMGIDIPTKTELIANQIVNKDKQKITFEQLLAKYLNVTSVRYLSCNGLKSVLEFLDNEKSGNKWCTSWYDGKYPIQFENDWKLFNRLD